MSSHENKRKFGKSTTALEVVAGVDLKGKTYFITGANSGIGYETTRALALQGGHVVMGCRNIAKAGEARATILKEKPDAKIDLIEIDNSNLQSVSNCAKEYLAKGWSLDCLILNAGIYAPVPRYTTDNFEGTFQANHLSHFLLTNLLTPKLIANAPSRIVLVASDAHRMAHLFKLCPEHITRDYFSPRDPKRVNSDMTAYNLSKLCNIWHGRVLHERLADKGVTVTSLHPGVIKTNFQRNSAFLGFLTSVIKPMMKNIEQGAATTVYCSVSPDVTSANGGGKYFEDCKIGSATATAMDMGNATKFWSLSEEMLKEFQEQRGINLNLN